MQSPDVHRLLPIVLGRPDSLFRQDMDLHRRALGGAVAGSRVLVVGAAGSIGSAFVRRLAGLGPRSIDLIDLSENALVELIRDLRSGRSNLRCELRTYAIGIGSIEFDRFVVQSRPFDYVLNFAALKHVRAERDPFTLMRMLDTNVLALHHALQLLGKNRARRTFSVSSDKAVRPASLMGASKRWMERILALNSESIQVSAARFANVAFSTGSLLHGFLLRLENRQPLAAPTNVRRYLISPLEAAELCLLACFLSDNREIYVPKLFQPKDALAMSEIAELVLRAAGLEPALCATEEEARQSPLLDQENPTRWPCYFSPAATSGEKELEEFVGPFEEATVDRFPSISVVSMDSAAVDGDRVQSACEALKVLRARSVWTKEEIVRIVRQAVPDLLHEERGVSLDERM